MCIISFDKALNITIHSHYPNLELTSPVYFNDGATYCVSPSQQADTGDIIETNFIIDLKQKDLKCVALYKLQRRCVTRTDNQPNNNTTSVENTATNTYLLVAWVVKDYDHNFCVCLMEFTDDFAWDEDKLWALYREYNDQFHMNYRSSTITWLMRDNAVMKMKLDVIYGSDYKLDIVMSEGVWVGDMKKPIEIDPKRLVLLVPMFIMLTHTVRLAIQPSFKLIIHNQSLNVDLVSPTYITANTLDCHRPPDYKVCAGDTMRSGFIINLDNAFCGVLIYKLQRRQSHESTDVFKDTSSTTHLLMAWEFSEYKLCTDVLLVEHDEGFDWEKDDLGELYRKNINRFRLCSDSVAETWSLYDNVALMTTFEIMNSNRILNIIISETATDNNTKMPVHIDLER
jgi:hypothetical protein